jgi:hypothetical protein
MHLRSRIRFPHAHLRAGELLGVGETASLLDLTLQGLRKRRRAGDFPAPAADLARGPVWTRSQLRAYAVARCERYHELVALAAEVEA